MLRSTNPTRPKELSDLLAPGTRRAPPAQMDITSRKIFSGKLRGAAQRASRRESSSPTTGPTPSATTPPHRLEHLRPARSPLPQTVRRGRKTCRCTWWSIARRPWTAASRTSSSSRSGWPRPWGTSASGQSQPRRGQRHRRERREFRTTGGRGPVRDRRGPFVRPGDGCPITAGRCGESSGLVSTLRDLRGKRRLQDLSATSPGHTRRWHAVHRRLQTRRLSRRGKGVMVLISDFLVKGVTRPVSRCSGARLRPFAIQVLSPRR